jgi:hypothetical protein
MRVLVCGGRTFGYHTQPGIDAETRKQRTAEFSFGLHALNDVLGDKSDVTIMGGGATGADHLGQCYASIAEFDFELYKADWDKYGKGAGPKRNQEMLDGGKPDLVIAFPGGNGTAHMVKIARRRQVPVVEIKYNENKGLQI